MCTKTQNCDSYCQVGIKFSFEVPDNQDKMDKCEKHFISTKLSEE